jgi:hypothetical protein
MSRLRLHHSSGTGRCRPASGGTRRPPRVVPGPQDPGASHRGRSTARLQGRFPGRIEPALRRRLVVSAPDGAQGRPAAHQERPRRSTGHGWRRAGELAAGASRGRVVAGQGRVAGWPIHRPALVGGADASMAERAVRAAGVAEPRRHVWLCDVDCGHGFWTRGERLKGVPAWVADTLVFGQANDPVDFLLCLNWAEHQHRKPSCPGGRLRTRARTTCAARGREVARRRTSGRRGGVGSRPRCLARPASGRPAGGRTPTDRPRSGAARRPASVAP